MLKEGPYPGRRTEKKNFCSTRQFDRKGRGPLKEGGENAEQTNRVPEEDCANRIYPSGVQIYFLGDAKEVSGHLEDREPLRISM